MNKDAIINELKKELDRVEKKVKTLDNKIMREGDCWGSTSTERSVMFGYMTGLETALKIIRGY